MDQVDISSCKSSVTEKLIPDNNQALTQLPINCLGMNDKKDTLDGESKMDQDKISRCESSVTEQLIQDKKETSQCRMDQNDISSHKSSVTELLPDDNQALTQLSVNCPGKKVTPDAESNMDQVDILSCKPSVPEQLMPHNNQTLTGVPINCLDVNDKIKTLNDESNMDQDDISSHTSSVKELLPDNNQTLTQLSINCSDKKETPDTESNDEETPDAESNMDQDDVSSCEKSVTELLMSNTSQGMEHFFQEAAPDKTTDDETQSSLADLSDRDCNHDFSGDDSDCDPNYSGDTSEESESDFSSDDDACIETPAKRRLIAPRNSVENDPGKMYNTCSSGVSNCNPRDVEENVNGRDLDSALVSSNQVSLFKKREKKPGCHNVYDKNSYCTFCHKSVQSKIARHLLTKHSTNERVRPILEMPKKSMERRVELTILTNEGNFKHNVAVLTKGNGCIVVGRRGPKTTNPNHFLPCEYCKKFIAKKTMSEHRKRCLVFKQLQTNSPPDDANAVRRSKNLLLSAVLQDEELIDISQRLRDDNLSAVIMRDQLIQRYIVLKVRSLGLKADQKQDDIYRVNQVGRTLARLLIEAQKKKPHADMDMLLRPENFDLLVESTKNLCLNRENPPLTLARLIQNQLGHIIQIKTGYALRQNDDVKCKEAADFKKLFDAEWSLHVTSVCTKKINALKMQQIPTLPLTEDLVKLKQFITSESSKYAKQLDKSHDSKDWTQLAKLVMVRLILLNKRRRAEVKELRVSSYMNRPDWHKERRGEMEMALSSADKLMADRLVHFIGSFCNFCGKFTLTIHYIL